MALVLFAGGLLLVAPNLIALSRAQLTTGRLMDVLPHPVDQQLVELRLLFEFPIAGSLANPQTVAIGLGRCDAFGNPLPDPQIPAAQWPAAAADYLRAIERGAIYTVAYQAADPAASARINADSHGLWRLTLGAICFLTPLLLWLSRLIGRSLNGLVRRLGGPQVNP